MAKRSRGPSLAILRLLPTLWQLPTPRMPAEDIKTSVQDRRRHEIPEEDFRRLNGRQQPRPPAKSNNSGPSETLQPHPSRSRNALDAGTPTLTGIENARKPSASVANPYQLIKSFVSTMILTHLLPSSPIKCREVLPSCSTPIVVAKLPEEPTQLAHLRPARRPQPGLEVRRVLEHSWPTSLTTSPVEVPAATASIGPPDWRTPAPRQAQQTRPARPVWIVEPT